LFQNKSLGRNIKGEIKKGLVIGTVARLHRQKNIPLLLKAGAKIRKSYPGIEIWVVGGGPLERKLQELSRNLGTNDTVCFLGERTDAPELMARFDLFVLPSLWEGLPYVLLEAAALKKPVIGTNIDGIREIIENDKTGILVSPKNPDELVGAAIRLLNNRLFAEKLGLNLCKKVCEKYSISLTINKIQKLYIQLFRQIERSST